MLFSVKSLKKQRMFSARNEVQGLFYSVIGKGDKMKEIRKKRAIATVYRNRKEVIL